MSRRARRILGALALVATLLGAVGLLIAWLLWAEHSQLVARRASAALGLEVGIGGGIQLEVFPELQFKARDVTVANLPGRPSPHLAEIGILELEISYLGLLRGRLEIDALELEQVTLWIEDDPNLQLSAAAAPESQTESRDLRFNIGSVEIRELALHYQPGDAGTRRSGRIETLRLEADGIQGPVHFASRGEFAGHRFDLTGEFGPLSDLYDAAPYPIELRGRLLDATFEIRGTAGQPTQMRELDLSISGELPGLPQLYEAFLEPDSRVPETGLISFQARLVRDAGPVAIEDLSVGTDTSGALYGSLTGSVGELATFREIDLVLELNARSLSFLQPMTETTLPAVESIDAKFEFSDRGSDLGVAGTVHLVLPDGLGRLEVEGSLADLRGVTGLDVTVRGEARDLGIVGNWLGLDRALPPLEPVMLHGRLRNPEQRISLDALTARAGTRDRSYAEVKGSIRDLERLEGVRLRADFGAADLSLLETYLDRPLPGGIGPITGHTLLTDEDGSLGLEHIRLHGGRKELLSIDLDGKFDDLREIDEIELDAKITARDLAVIGELVDAEVDPLGPVEFTGTLSGSDEQFQASGKLWLDRTLIDGRASGTFEPSARPSFRATLSSPQVWLDDVGIAPRFADQNTAPEVGSDGAPPDAGDEPAPRWWRSTEGLPFDLLRSLDFDLVLRADRISGRDELEVYDASASVRLEDGRLQIRDLQATWKGGDTHAGLVLDASTPEPKLSLEFELEGLDVEQFVSQAKETTQASGFVDAWVRLESRGQTPNEIRSELAGQLVAVMRDGTAAGKVSRLFARNLIGLTFPSMQLRRSVPLVSCFLASVEIESGIASVSRLEIQGGDITVTGSGTVDLARESYHLELVPRSRRRGIVSVVPVVRVRGPLWEPRVTPVHRTVATSIVEGVISNVVRPARSLLSRFRRGSDPEFRCVLPEREALP